MIAVGNVVGSNICNIALILGLAAAVPADHQQPLGGAARHPHHAGDLPVPAADLLQLAARPDRGRHPVRRRSSLHLFNYTWP